ELEVVIVDGHSEDGTVEIARKYGCRVVYESVGTIGGARNIGVRNSSGEFIVFTDADCVAERDWLKNLLKEFRDENIASVGGPNITPEDDSEFGKCVGDVFELLSRAGARYAYNSKEVVEIYSGSTGRGLELQSCCMELLRFILLPCYFGEWEATETL
ncbi:MAG: hypothetical protein DSO01_06335, partial [Archaeoglobi archaeon]